MDSQCKLKISICSWRTVAVLIQVFQCIFQDRLRSVKLFMARSCGSMLLILTCANILGTAMSGVLLLLWSPSVAFLLGCACLILHCGVMFMSVRIEHLLGAVTSIGHVAKVSPESKRMARRTRKKVAKKNRTLIFTFGSKFLRWFERLLCFWLLMVQLFLPLGRGGRKPCLKMALQMA